MQTASLGAPRGPQSAGGGHSARDPREPRPQPVYPSAPGPEEIPGLGSGLAAGVGSSAPGPTRLSCTEGPEEATDHVRQSGKKQPPTRKALRGRDAGALWLPGDAGSPPGSQPLPAGPRPPPPEVLPSQERPEPPTPGLERLKRTATSTHLRGSESCHSPAARPGARAGAGQLTWPRCSAATALAVAAGAAPPRGQERADPSVLLYP